MLSPGRRAGRRASAALLLVAGLTAASATSARADLAQFGDAMADVTTFGAWGKSRDTAHAEIDALKLRFQEELQRAANRTEALVSTTRIEEKAKFAIDAQQVAQALLRMIAAVDLLLAQQKQVVVDRFNAGVAITRFDEWFDSFVVGTTEQLNQLIGLFQRTATGDQDAIDAALAAAKLGALQTEADAQEARAELRTAFEAVTSNALTQAMQTVLGLRASLVQLLEDRRQVIRQLIIDMAAEDAARRALCAPPGTLGVTCNGGTCRYFAPDSGQPLPCADLVYLNAFPVAAIKAIYDDSQAFALNVEFFVDLNPLGTVKSPTVDRFRDPQEVFGDALRVEALVPPPFLAPQGCGRLDSYGRRLTEALDYAALFQAAEDRSAASRQNIQTLLGWRPLIEFWLEVAKATFPATASCRDLPAAKRAKLAKLAAAVAAAEGFGTALSNNTASVSDDPKSLTPVDNLAHDF